MSDYESEGCRFDSYWVHYIFGKWLSLVEHLVWDQGVAGSNPVFPISFCYVLVFYCGGVAQLARASGSYPGGRGFDPLRRYFGPLAQLVRADGS